MILENLLTQKNILNKKQIKIFLLIFIADNDINNGIIEVTNNLIKYCKRMAFAIKIRSFYCQIFLIKEFIKE